MLEHWDPADDSTLSHFRPYSWTCDHCAVRFDAILRTETFAEDFEFISHAMDLNDTKKVCIRTNLEKPHSLGMRYWSPDLGGLF